MKNLFIGSLTLALLSASAHAKPIEIPSDELAVFKETTAMAMEKSKCQEFQKGSFRIVGSDDSGRLVMTGAAFVRGAVSGSIDLDNIAPIFQFVYIGVDRLYSGKKYESTIVLKVNTDEKQENIISYSLKEFRTKSYQINEGTLTNPRLRTITETIPTGNEMACE